MFSIVFVFYIGEKLWLQRDINDVNEIYKSLGRLVHEQGETIDSIEANIERTHVSVRGATAELRKASNYMVSRRFIFILVSSD